jgi:hypothetical protein
MKNNSGILKQIFQLLGNHIPQALRRLRSSRLNLMQPEKFLATGFLQKLFIHPEKKL